MLVLSLNLGWNDSSHGHGEDARINCQEQDDPLVSIRSVLDFPFLRLCVPGMPSSDRRSYLIMRQRCQSLGLIHVASPLDRIIEHLLNDRVLNRKLLLVDVFFYLFYSNPIVKILIDRITEVSDAVHGDFQGLVTLIQVLLGARKVARIPQVFHAHLGELGLRLNRILVDK